MTIINSLNRTLLDLSDEKEASRQSKETRKLFDYALAAGQDPQSWKNTDTVEGYGKILISMTDKFSELLVETKQEADNLSETTNRGVDPSTVEALQRKLAQTKNKLDFLNELHEVVSQVCEAIRPWVPRSPHGLGKEMVELLEQILETSTTARVIASYSCQEAEKNLASNQTNRSESPKNSNSDQGNCCNIM